MSGRLLWPALSAALAALALADAATGWAVLPAYVIAPLGLVGAIGLVVSARSPSRNRLTSVVAGLVLACFTLHLVYSGYLAYETKYWDRLSRQKAVAALSTVASTFDGFLDELRADAGMAAARRGVAESIASGDRSSAFDQAASVASSLERRYTTAGVVLLASDGRVVAWSGDLPSYFDVRLAARPEAGIDLKPSTAHYWLEAYSPVAPSDTSGAAGWVGVFRAIDSRYPGVLPGQFARTLAEDLSRRVAHQVDIGLGAGAGVTGAASDGDLVSGEIRLPEGRIAGTATVRPRSLEDERSLQRGRGLLAASLILVALIIYGAALILRSLLGARPAKASPRNLTLAAAVVLAARLGIAYLRDPLRLSDLRFFTSYDYATQIPTGVLRSPADLALTAVALGAGVVLVALAAMRAMRGSAAARSGRNRARRGGALLGLAAAIGAAALACGVAAAIGAALRRILGDSSAGLLSVSPFDFSATSMAMKTGVFLVTAIGLVAGSSLVGAAVWFLRGVLVREGGGRGAARRRYAAPAAVALVSCLSVGVALAGAGWTTALAAALFSVGGLALGAAIERRRTVSAAGMVVALALAAAAIQYPIAIGDFYSKHREAVESRAARVAARTDAWKMSLLDEALALAATDTQVRASLAAGQGRLDAEALRLWANSILSAARVPCGVIIVGADGAEVGRFALEDIGDVAGIEGSIRAARFAGEPTAFVSTAALGGGGADLYVGVAPLFQGDTHVGSVVLAIPYRYSDIASWAGLRPTMFEAMETSSAGGVSALDYSASLVRDGRIVATSADYFEVGGEVGDIDAPVWTERRGAGGRYASYFVPLERQGEALGLSFRMLSASDAGVYLMAVVLDNMTVALALILLGAAVKVATILRRRASGGGRDRFRWSFATKLALAFLLIAIVPTLILGSASSGFVRARLREVMESRAGESLKLGRLALERLVGGEATRLARNPILMDELLVEPSILGVLVTGEYGAAVCDASGRTVASYGDAAISADVLDAVAWGGRAHNWFVPGAGLVAESAAPVRDVISPDSIVGCVLVARTVDDGLARRLAVDLAADINFYGQSRVAASSKQELFVAEVMPQSMSSDAYADCILRGREVHFTWERVGNADMVIGYSPLRGLDGKPVGAMSVPLVFSKDAVGRRMEWTSTALSYLVAIVIGFIFVMGFVLARRISGPIGELISGTMRVSSSDYGFTIPKPSDDEIGDLVTSFNQMAAKVREKQNLAKEREQYIEAMVANVNAGIIFTDSRGLIHTINGEAERLLGVKARRAKGREVRGLLRAAGAQNLAALVREAEVGAGVSPREIALGGSGGEEITVRAAASVVRGPRRRSMGVVIVFEDVTELISSKKLVAWSEMARQVAHEIKNPLTPMKLSAQQILQAHKDGASDFDGILEDGLAIIIEEIEALRRIAVEFSQFSRMPQRSARPADLNQIVQDSLGQYERAVGSSVTITKQLDPSIPRVVVDPDELKRVLVNLIDNAIQAMPGGGRLEVRSVAARGGADRAGDRAGGSAGHKVRVTSRAPGARKLRDFVEVTFTDTGAGISEENAVKLFEPNFSTKSHGTGLGLAISKGTIDAYGGEIAIESTAGVGTSVSVRLPVEAGATQQPRHQRRAYRRRRRHRPA
ncbi:MAG: ATP-binding protein [bacterium]